LSILESLRADSIMIQKGLVWQLSLIAIASDSVDWKRYSILFGAPVIDIQRIQLFGCNNIVIQVCHQLWNLTDTKNILHLKMVS